MNNRYSWGRKQKKREASNTTNEPNESNENNEYSTTSKEQQWEQEEELEDRADPLQDFPEHEELEITGVEQARWPRLHYKLFFGELKLVVHEDVMIKYRMLKGYSFTKDALRDIMAANKLQAAYASSINYLSYRSRTRTEVARKLKEKGHDEHVIETTLERLEQEKLIDDHLFAEQWARQRVRTQKKGKVWIRQELRQKGVQPAHIEQALGEIDEDEELVSATMLARKKWNSTSGEWLDKKRKTMAYLMRRGYSSDLVRRALAAMEEQDQMEEEND
ncbi:regulatory protein RecX [Paenibacillus hunanensis]|uniref:regulatory protein RecX n=1 Tax=Paenibacillus hunanensis TaxID=539262 RepID=UPI002A6A304A|nr:regulatory protein RecX [Paenibacillus hunanensis]WPP39773.1 regulatory protein RecX [Paenibacillus hunanensis]